MADYMGKLDKIEQSLSNKSRNYWAKMRTNYALIMRAEVADEITLDSFKAELADILDSGVLTYPHTLWQIGLGPYMTLQERKEALCLKSLDLCRSEAEKLFLADMANKAQEIRKTNWSWRIGQEAQEKQAQGWHPFFVTLTIDPVMCDGKERVAGARRLPAYSSPKELWTEGRELRRYIRRLVNVVCKEMGHPPAHKRPYRPESDYVTYAGVIEHGKSREHHHGHFLIWLRRIPASWCACPNAGIRNPANRDKNECLPLRTYWPWSLPGLSPALYFRSVGDVWETEYSFVLPLKEGRPMKVSVPRTAGAYITKYLAKEHREWHHRMKATRNIGIRRLKELIWKMEPRVVEALTWRAESSSLNHSLMTIHSVPLGLVRSVAKQQNYLNKFRKHQLELRDLLEVNCNIFSRMLWSVRDGARPDRMGSSEFFGWVGRHLPGQRGYCKQRQIAAHSAVALEYPPDKQRVKSVKIGANDIGYS